MPSDSDLCIIAVRHNNIALLQSVSECMDRRTCKMAAYWSHLEILRWAVQHGCEWDLDECIQAHIDGMFRVTINCPRCPGKLCDPASHPEYTACGDWLAARTKSRS